MIKFTRIADKATSFEPIEFKSSVARMFILLIAFGFYMAFISVSRTWIPVAQTEPAPVAPVTVEHQPIEKQEVVVTDEPEPADDAKTERQESTEAVIVQQTQQPQTHAEPKPQAETESKKSPGQSADKPPVNPSDNKKPDTPPKVKPAEAAEPPVKTSKVDDEQTENTNLVRVVVSGVLTGVERVLL